MSRYTSEEQKAIASTIFAQLGGNRLIAMTGAKMFAVGENDNEEVYLTFRIGRNAKSVNHVKVTLNALDLYNVEYINIREANLTIKALAENIYNDMLKTNFEENTGMYLSL